jgi:hypothetical protein
MKLRHNEHSVITNILLYCFGNFSAQINPVITNPRYNEQQRTGCSTLTVIPL